MTDRHEEHYESIPWDSLVTGDARRRRRWIHLAVGLVVALAIGGAVGNGLGRGVPGTSGSAIASTSTSTSTTSPTTSSSAPNAPAATPEAELAARSHAEWFVADYFTVDGSEVTRRSVADRLPPGVEVPEVDGDARSFVESVFTTSVEPLGAGRYRVVAVVRALAAGDGVSYRRQPARAVAVVVEVSGRQAAIVDLPRPVPTEVPAGAALDIDAAEAPANVLRAAAREAEMWGTPIGEPVAGTVEDIWRVVHVVEDDEGLTWPVASWLDDEGNPTTPPAG